MDILTELATAMEGEATEVVVIRCLTLAQI